MKGAWHGSPAVMILQHFVRQITASAFMAVAPLFHSLPPMESSFRATLMSADTGASQVYSFKADAGLFRKPARQIVRAFMEHMRSDPSWANTPSYKLTSATKKAKNRVVMATGSLLVQKGELPFLLMVSPDAGAAAGE